MTAATIDRPRVAAKRLPAFARELDALRRSGHRPAGETVLLHLDSWPPRQHRTRSPDGDEIIVPGPAPQVRWPRVTVPSDADPEELRFDFLRDLDVLVAHRRSRTTPQRLRALLRELLAANARAVVVLDEDLVPPKLWHVKSITRGVEVSL
tara:strand:+ start:626 stop:1078 length:453 start_codon:yes stop_codon:yes gene_type:complete